MAAGGLKGQDKATYTKYNICPHRRAKRALYFNSQYNSLRTIDQLWSFFIQAIIPWYFIHAC